MNVIFIILHIIGAILICGVITSIIACHIAKKNLSSCNLCSGKITKVTAAKYNSFLYVVALDDKRTIEYKDSGYIPINSEVTLWINESNNKIYTLQQKADKLLDLYRISWLNSSLVLMIPFFCLISIFGIYPIIKIFASLFFISGALVVGVYMITAINDGNTIRATFCNAKIRDVVHKSSKNYQIFVEYTDDSGDNCFSFESDTKYEIGPIETLYRLKNGNIVTPDNYTGFSKQSIISTTSLFVANVLLIVLAAFI